MKATPCSVPWPRGGLESVRHPNNQTDGGTPSTPGEHATRLPSDASVLRLASKTGDAASPIF